VGNKAFGRGINSSMRAMRAAADDWAAHKENEPDGNRRREPRASMEDAPVAGNKGERSRGRTSFLQTLIVMP